MVGDILMGNANLGQPHSEGVGGVGSPPRPTSHSMRHRGQSSSTSSSSSSSQKKQTTASAVNGLHFTNIKRINVINNFGVETGERRNSNSFWNWIILRVFLVSLVLGWFGVLALVMKRSPPPTSAAASSPNTHSNTATSTANSTMGLRQTALVLHDNSTTVAEIQAELPKVQQPPASIFELSLFGSNSPKDFQRFTPHAPSCFEPLSPESVSFTLVSQLSNDRLWMVPYHCQRWGNKYPMSIAVFTDKTVEYVKSELVARGCSEELLTVQTIKRTKYDPMGTEYPVNLMRNLAISKVKTSHIVYADVDFWPATDLHSILSNITVKERLASDYKLATVIPVFQMNRQCRRFWDCRNSNIPKMPKNKDEMIEIIITRKGSSFDPTNKGGHGSTMYKKWLTQETGTFVDLPCINSNRYEPYLSVRYCSELPPFQEGFTGYGKNKMTVSSILDQQTVFSF